MASAGEIYLDSTLLYLELPCPFLFPSFSLKLFFYSVAYSLCETLSLIFFGLGQIEMQGEYVDESEKDAAALKV
jgi:hypothetical protein